VFKRKHKRYSKSLKTELERRQKISETLKGRIPKNLTQLHSMSYTTERRQKISKASQGRKHTEETKRKISEAKRDPLRPVYRAVRECYKSREWRVSIFKRDNYTCVICKIRGGTLNADHYPKRFVDILRKNNIISVEQALDLDELWNIENGRTLCVKCHTETDTWGNKFRL
jgi:5-methylcytosine-specific restriction endonuclease McrA